MSAAARVPSTPVALSTSSVYPERTPDAFDMAARLGYDGVEVMVYTDPVSQDADVLTRLRDYHQLPILAVHAPSLLLTQRVWGREPWEKLRRAKDLAERVGARVVVVHPPFRWQVEYVRGFEKGLAALAAETDVIFAVENMYPLRVGTSEVVPYAPHWDPTALDVPHSRPKGVIGIAPLRQARLNPECEHDLKRRAGQQAPEQAPAGLHDRRGALHALFGHRIHCQPRRTT